MGLLKEILDKIDVHQEPVYLDSFSLIIKELHKSRQKAKEDEKDSKSKSD